MHPAYFDTRFRCDLRGQGWPEAFCIVSAYATTGEAWSPERNQSADESLRLAIFERGGWHRRVTGYSPVTGHAEPSWAVGISLEEACRLGGQFSQDAIYWVESDRLYVFQCHVPEVRAFVDLFSHRLDP